MTAFLAGIGIGAALAFLFTAALHFFPPAKEDK